MRRSVNKNIAKPIQDVLSRQNLWQVSQFTTLLHNESDGQFQQVPDTSNETQKAEKYKSLESTASTNTGNSETNHISGKHAIENSYTPNNEEQVSTSKLNYDSSLLDRDDIEHCYIGANTDYRVVPNSESPGNEKNFKDPENFSSAKENTERSEEYVGFDNIKENEYCNEFSTHENASRTEHNERLKQFKEGVMEKIKQGCYLSNSTFNYRPFNLRDTYGPNSVKKNEPFPDNRETENEYVRSILNGIPSQSNVSYRSYNSTAIQCPYKKSYLNNNINANKKHPESDSDCQNSEDIPESESLLFIQNMTDKIPIRLNLKNNVINRTFQQTLTPSKTGKVSTAVDNNNNESNVPNRDSEELQSRSYSLRNGFEESDILKYESTIQRANDQSFHAPNKFSINKNEIACNHPESYRLRNGFNKSNLNEYDSKDNPVKSEFTVQKKSVFGSNFKEFIKTDDTPQHQIIQKEPYSSLKDETLTKPTLSVTQEENTSNINNVKSVILKSEYQISFPNHVEDKPIAKKTSNNNIIVTELQNDTAKECNTNTKIDSETLNEKENSLKKELQILNNKLEEFKSNVNPLECNKIGSYYQSDRQNKFSSESAKLDSKLVTEPCELGVQNQVKTEVKPSVLKQAKAEENEVLTMTDKPPPKKMINETLDLKSDSSKTGSTKDFKNDEKDIVKATAANKKYFEQGPELKLKSNTLELDHHNNPKLNNAKEDSVAEKDTLFTEGYKSKYGEKDLQESMSAKSITPSDKGNNDSEKVAPKTDLIKEKSKVNANNTAFILVSKANDTQKMLENKVITKEKQQSKATLKGLGNIKDDKEKSAEISFPGITPLTFCTPVPFENINKSEIKTKSKTDFKEKNVVINKVDANKNTLLSMPGAKDFKSEKSENGPLKISIEQPNKMKPISIGLQNNVKQALESQINIGFNLVSSRMIGKSTVNSLNKKETDELEVKKVRPNSMKQVEPKKGANNKTARDSQANQGNADKIANLLKEHRMLLELLLEKLNGRITHSLNDITSGAKKISPSEELKDSEKSSLNSSSIPSSKEKFKIMFNNCLNSQEKLKRLHPRNSEPYKVNLSSNNAKDDCQEDVKKSDIPEPSSATPFNYRWRDIEPPREEKTKVKLLIDKSLKRFHIVTMMTSPSGRCVPKKSSEPLLDGSTLAKYNYSPLKQILSQYRIDWSVKPTRLMQTPTNDNKFTAVNNEKKRRGHNFCYSGFLNTKSINKSKESSNDEKASKSKDDLAKIKKIAIVNKKKNYNMKDNIKKRHLNSRNKIQTNIVSTLSRIGRSTKKSGTKKEVKGGDADNLGKKVVDENKNLKVNNATYNSIEREFRHKSTYKHKTKSENKIYLPLSHTSLNNDLKVNPMKIKKKSLKNVEKMFKYAFPSDANLKSVSSGLGNKSDIFNLEYTNNIAKGSMWAVTPEYSHSKAQWNLPIKMESINNKLRINKSNKNNSGKTIDLLNSKVLTLSSKAISSKPSSLPVLKSSVLPLPLNFFNHKSIHKSETGITKIVGIKKISTCNTDKECEKDQETKLSQNMSDLKIPLPPSLTITDNSKTCNNEEAGTITTLAKHNSNLLGSSKDDKCCKCSVIARNNVVFDRIKNSNILNTIKPSLFSFRSMSHKDWSSNLVKKSSTQIEKDLNLLPMKQTIDNGQYLKLITLPQMNSLKSSWNSITNKVKCIIRDKCKAKTCNCCTPNFDEMMVSISKDIEKESETNISRAQNNHCSDESVKKKKSNELLIMSNKGKNHPQNVQLNGKPKVLIAPQFLKEEVKNY